MTILDDIAAQAAAITQTADGYISDGQAVNAKNHRRIHRAGARLRPLFAVAQRGRQRAVTPLPP